MNPANDNIPADRPQWFDDLLAQYDKFIQAKCAAYLMHEDLYHDTLIRLMERWHQYRPDGNFMAWSSYHVRGIVAERARRDRQITGYPQYRPQVLYAPTQEISADIAKAVSLLPPQQRAVVMKTAVGFSGVEIGAEEGVTRQAINLRLAEARKVLAALLPVNDNEKKNAAA